MSKNTELERRCVDVSLRMDKRSEDAQNKPGVIEGTAAKFNKRTKIGEWFYEEILPGAFDNVLQDDVRCLLNHDTSQVLGRTASNTLDIWVDEVGFHYRYTTPNRSFAKDLEDMIATGDVSQSSFQFKVEEAIWIEQEDDLDIRQIKKIGKLVDVAPVTFPAYQDTSVAKRSHEVFESEKQPKMRVNSVREAQLILNKNKYFNEEV